jgi:hypothetical protein
VVLASDSLSLRGKSQNLIWVLAALLAFAIGAGLVLSPPLVLGGLGGLVILALLALPLPAIWWVMAALIAAMLTHGLSSLGLLPAWTVGLDLMFGWLALVGALLRRGTGSSSDGPRLIRWLFALAVLVFLSGVLHGLETERSVLSFALLGLPFAVVAALSLDRPTESQLKAAMFIGVVLIALQFPVVLVQWLLIGSGDPIRGTTASAHILGAVLAVTSLVLIAIRDWPWYWRVAGVALLLSVPLLGDAKQVIAALPVVLIVGGWLRRFGLTLTRALMAVAAFAVLVISPLGGLSVQQLRERALGQENAKLEVTQRIIGNLLQDPATLLIGEGPATTVSRAAFITVGSVRVDSPVRAINLDPAPLAGTYAAPSLKGGLISSATGGLSSAIGLVGDLGIFGFLAYSALILSVLLALSRRGSAISSGGISCWLLFIALGLVFDWWEQPPFAVVLGFVTGAILSSPVVEKPPRRQPK